MKFVKKLLAGIGAVLAMGAPAEASVISQSTQQEQKVTAVPTKETKLEKKKQSLKNLKGGGDVTGFHKIPSTRQRAKGGTFKQKKRRGF